MDQKHFTSVIHLVSFTIIIFQCGQAENLLLKSPTRECVCPGDIVTYECTVFGGTQGVSTVWKGDFFNCPTGIGEIHLIHGQREGFNPHTCNDGKVVARFVRIENNSFISQLNVTLTRDIAGKGIECIRDNGTNTEGIGATNLTSATLPLPPENISWIVTTHQQQDMITFKWSAHSLYCHDQTVYYKITAKPRDCGICPATTNYTNVTCTDVPTDGSVCMIAIQTVICNITGELSCPLSALVISKESKCSSGSNTALVLAIILGVTLAVSLVGFIIVTVLLIKSKTKVQQTTATTAILDRIAPEAVENRLVHDNNNIITTSENVAYAVHL